MHNLDYELSCIPGLPVNQLLIVLVELELETSNILLYWVQMKIVEHFKEATPIQYEMNFLHLQIIITRDANESSLSFVWGETSVVVKLFVKGKVMNSTLTNQGSTKLTFPQPELLWSF